MTLANTCLLVLQTALLPKAVINAKDQEYARGKFGKNVPWDISMGLYLKYSVTQSNKSVTSKELKINFIKIPTEDANEVL